MTSSSGPHRRAPSALRTLALTALSVAVLVGGLAGCGADSQSGNDLISGRTDAAEAEAQTTVSAGASLGGMTAQAAQLAASLPQFAQLDEALAAPTTPTAAATSTPSAGSAADGTLNGCAVVTSDTLLDSLGLDIPTPPATQASAYGDPSATDCVYASAAGIVVVRATTVAGSDLSEQAITAALTQPDTATITGATRGYVFVPTPAATSGNAVIKVVVGERGISVALTAAQPVTQAQAEQLGTELVSALQ